jgi:hypothetical protein
MCRGEVKPGFIEHTVFKKILMDFHYRGIGASPGFLKIFLIGE